MSSALPEDALGVFIGVLVYSLVCLLLSLLLSYMLWQHGERYSYIQLISSFVSLSTLASVCQQIHYAVQWRYVKVQRFENSRKPINSPADVLGGRGETTQMGLFWIQFYCYNVEALLILFWAISLFRKTWNISVNGIVPHEKLLSWVSKTVAILFPILLVTLIQLPGANWDPLVYVIIDNALLFVSLGAGSVFTALVLFQYLRTKNTWWSFQSTPNRSVSTTDATKRAARKIRRQKRDEQWLIVRFGIGFIVLSGFQVCVIIFEVLGAHDVSVANQPGAKPDFSIRQTKQDLILFMPGVTASLVDWLIFGTTSTFRHEYGRAFRRLGKCMRVRPRRVVLGGTDGHTSDVELHQAPGSKRKHAAGYSVSVSGAHSDLSPLPSPLPDRPVSPR